MTVHRAKGHRRERFNYHKECGMQETEVVLGGSPRARQERPAADAVVPADVQQKPVTWPPTAGSTPTRGR